MLGRETPIYILQHLILSFGGDFVLQDELPDDENERKKVMKGITHMCMDRPLPGDSLEKGKEYVQPQYVLDCINNLFLLPTKAYQPGIAAPAHLSPFVDNEEEGYLPERQREINALAGVESKIAGTTVGDDASSSEDEAEQKDEEEGAKEGKATVKGDADSSSDEEGTSEELSDSEEEEAPAKKGPGAKAKKDVAPKEAKKIQKKVLTKADRTKKNEKLKRDLKKEQQELGKMLMTNRQRKLYEEVEKSKKTKKAAAKKLVEKKRKLEKHKS